ncbi:single-stranded DNA-binding protein [Kitasatospora sp. NPDC059088]|uniref:single-stranded DNA-binding protein n=1 Tax=Kitasatospora sp. NPDC059088 TaxID=3346722 RepID=UPI0036ABFF53
MSAHVTTEAQPAVGERTHVQIHPHSPTLLVLNARFVLPFGTQDLSLAMPAAPQGSPPWQCAALALYLGRLRQGEVEASAAALRDYLLSRAPEPTYLWTYEKSARHDAQVTCLLDFVLDTKPAAWRGCSLSVLEGEDGCGGFRHERIWRGCRDVVKGALDEITGERDRLRAVNRRFNSSELLKAIESATALADDVESVWLALRADANRDHGSRARTAIRGTAVEAENRESILMPRAAPLIVTGTLHQAADQKRENDGGLATRLQLLPDEEFRQHLSAVPDLLVCRLEGELGTRALQQGLRRGDRVAVRGRLVVRHYRGDDGIPRSATLFHADGFGPLLD